MSSRSNPRLTAPWSVATSPSTLRSKKCSKTTACAKGPTRIPRNTLWKRRSSTKTSRHADIKKNPRQSRRGFLFGQIVGGLHAKRVAHILKCGFQHLGIVLRFFKRAFEQGLLRAAQIGVVDHVADLTHVKAVSRQRIVHAVGG